LKTIVQLLIAALVIVACARGGEAAWRYYELQDAVEQELRFGNAKTTSQLLQRVIELAAEKDVELTKEDVTVDVRDNATRVAVSYIEPIALVPGLYTRNQQFDFEVNVHLVRPLTIDTR
jgi:hypothetical protein